MKIVEFGSDLTINSTNVETYCVASGGVKLNTSGVLGDTAYDLYLRSNNGSVTMTDSYKLKIFPTNTAKPYQIKAQFGTRTYTKGTQKLYFENNLVWEVEIDNNTKYNTKSKTFTEDIVSDITRNSGLKWETHTNSTAAILAVTDFNFIFSFYQYEHKADIAKFTSNINALGIKTVQVSNTNPYHGDQVIYTAELKENSVFIGWYSDPERKNLVSTSQSYIIDEANTDMILYAYAIQYQDVMFKQNNQWKKGIAIWLRKNNEWQFITKDEIPVDVGYEIRESQQNE